MGMRDQLAQLEHAFVEETEAARRQREAVQRQVAARADQRRRDKVHRRGFWRFLLLCLILTATAVGVALAMFETLYLVMG